MNRDVVVIATIVICVILVMCVWPVGYLTGVAVGKATPGAAVAAAAAPGAAQKTGREPLRARQCSARRS